MLRLLRLRRELRLAAVGLDHHQARALEQRLRVDLRFFASGFFASRLFARRLFARRLFEALRFASLLVPDRFVARLILSCPRFRLLPARGFWMSLFCHHVCRRLDRRLDREVRL